MCASDGSHTERMFGFRGEGRCLDAIPNNLGLSSPQLSPLLQKYLA